MKKFLPVLLALLCLAPLSLLAQKPSRTTIKGVIRDTTDAVAEYATVMLLSPVDSTLVNFSRSDEQGNFMFKNIKNSPYIFKASYIGHIPYQQTIEPSDTDVSDLGVVRLKPISTELMEVVIKTAKAPLRIRGDTIEYDATTFKVPPGSTVEDLLRRLPGIEVGADGSIKAQGKDVNRVYVDGKTFFGDDPKSATKNLGAETISKVQVYNEKSEQAKLTGVEDGKKEKAMNLELKEEFKKGAFGKVTAAVGTEERWAARGNYNRFDEKQQLSFIGFANNINETGVNWEDYGEFKGQNSFNDFDNGDFGFNSGGGRMYYFGDNGLMNNFDGRGFTKNHGGGVNYNFDNKKIKANANYVYNQTELNLDQFTFRETFLNNGSVTNSDTTARTEFRNNHSVAARMEHEMDSSNVLIVKTNMRISSTDNRNRQAQFFSENGTDPTNNLRINNTSDLGSLNLNGAAIFRHRFKKKGRSFAVSAAYNNNQSDGTDNLFSINEFFNAQTPTEQIRLLNLKDNTTWQAKASLLFTETLHKRWFLETFYNFSQTTNAANRQTQDPGANYQRVDALSVYYDYQVQYNRIGTDLRYSHEGMNISAGLAGQRLQLDGRYSLDEGLPLLTDPILRTFDNLVPYLDVNYDITSNLSFGADYTYQVTEPRLNDLQPVPNVTNPAFRNEGNPNLTPERSHGFSFNLNYWDPASFANVGIGSNYNLYDNQIVYNQTVEIVDSIGVRTTSRPDNVSGGNRFNAYLWSNFPIIKTKLTMNVSGNVNAGRSPAFVNDVQNETDNLGYDIRLGFSLTPSPSLILSAGGNLGFNNISYSIRAEQNQKIQNHGANASVKWQFVPKTFLESNFNYSLYKNDRFDFNQEVPIWNASVRRLLGPANRLEMRLAAFDIFNRRINITQNGTQNYVSRNTAPTLARYFMVSLSYNLRGYEDKVKKNNWW
ncbi:MAG: outer membrane beta-barrel protein [Saprospiraceae bacterium]